MVIDKGTGLLGPPAQQPWGPSILVPQSVILCVPHCLLQNTFGGKVKGGNTTSRGRDPVTQDLARSILVIIHCVAIPPIAKSKGSELWKGCGICIRGAVLTSQHLAQTQVTGMVAVVISGHGTKCCRTAALQHGRELQPDNNSLCSVQRDWRRT